jgi:hypothetical protein
MPKRETKKALIVVRTYPTPAQKSAESSCTAAITDNGQWLRLFPVPWRYLGAEEQFRRYQWVELTVEKASDPRPESYKLTQNGIKIISPPLSTSNQWLLRREIVEPLRAHCLCCLVRKRDRDGHPTLGVFKPKTIEKLIIEQDAPDWTAAQLAILRQGHLFAEQPKQQLEKIPHKFRYKFWCDESNCNGHKLSCTDWEMAESWRSWKTQYGTGWEQKFRQRYEHEMIRKFDTCFFVGTVHQHPSEWIIVGLFYPPPVAQARLSFSPPACEEPPQASHGS